MELIQRISLLHIQTVEHFFFYIFYSSCRNDNDCPFGRVEKCYLQRASEIDSVWNMHAGWRVSGINLDVIM